MNTYALLTVNNKVDSLARVHLMPTSNCTESELWIQSFYKDNAYLYYIEDVLYGESFKHSFEDALKNNKKTAIVIRKKDTFTSETDEEALLYFKLNY